MDYKPIKSIPGVQYAQEKILLFNNKSHLANHLSYLFRTDKSQRWTNEQTPDCAYSYFTQTGWVTGPLPTERDVRENRRQGIIDMVKKQWGQNAYKNLAMGLTYFYDSDADTVQVGASDIQTLTKIFTEETFTEYPDLIPLLYVCHADQGITHIHRLYYICPQITPVSHPDR